MDEFLPTPVKELNLVVSLCLFFCFFYTTSVAGLVMNSMEVLYPDHHKALVFSLQIESSRGCLIGWLTFHRASVVFKELFLRFGDHGGSTTCAIMWCWCCPELIMPEDSNILILLDLGFIVVIMCACFFGSIYIYTQNNKNRNLVLIQV